MERDLRAVSVNIVAIVLGAAVYAVGLNYFILPNRLMEGGITGIALLLNYAFDIRPSVTTLLINLPLFIMGFRALGKLGMAYTVLGTVSLSASLWVMETAVGQGWIIPFYSENDLLLAALYAGVTLGVGLGIVFRFGGTTGGIDIVARMFHKFRGWSMGRIILTIDAAILLASLIYLPKEKILYTLISVYISTKVIDFIQEGAYAAKAFTIVSERAGDIARAVTEQMERGVTLFPARGAYSNQSREVLYCVVSRQEVHKLKTLVRNIDPRAFMVISDCHDVLGEGFRPE
jgi:uncharacterized membrane-anchored protein YitT (DUF2179 family)